MKKFFALCLMIAILLTATATAETSEAMYYRFGNVIDLEYDTDVVTVDDGLGNLWEFYGVDYLFYGDLVVMIMSDHGTPEWIYDDFVLNAYKCDIEEAEDIIALFH